MGPEPEKAQKIERESEFLNQFDQAIYALIDLGWDETELTDKVVQAVEEHEPEDDDEE